MANISLFEVSRLSFLDSPISELDKITLREFILDLKGHQKNLHKIKIFISVEKDRHGNFILYYKNKYHHDASTIAYYLAAIIAK